MENHTYLISKLFGYDITVNIPSVITTLITVVLTFIFVMFITSRIKLRPDSKRQNMAELLAFFVSDNIIKGNVDWKKYGKGLWATALTLISFIAIANTIGVLIEVSYDGVVYVNSITADPTFTFTLVGTYTSSGIGIAPFKIIEEFTNLLTLSMRLFGNIYAGEVLLALLATLATAGVFGAITGIAGLVVWKGFSLFIGFIQAYIFTILSFIYLSHKINDEH